MSPTDLPCLSAESTSAPKSCTAPAKIEPITTHNSAGLKSGLSSALKHLNPRFCEKNV